MKNIPNISFKTSEGVTDIEIIDLTELFSRIEKNPTHDPRLPHRISFFALLLVTNGTGIHQLDLKNYSIQKGDVLRIAKGQVHAFERDPSYNGYLVVFTEDFILKYFSQSSVDFISQFYNYHITEPLIDGGAYNDFFLEQVMMELQSKNTYVQKDIIAKMLELYLLRLERLTFRYFPTDLSRRHQALFFDFKQLLENNYSKTRNVKDYADQLHVTPKHLNQVVKDVTLNTAKNFIDQYVMLEIKRHILCSTLSLKELAFLSGFDEMTNFTKFFKNKTGISPKEYKALL